MGWFIKGIGMDNSIRQFLPQKDDSYERLTKAEDDKFLSYDKKQTFGLEFATGMYILSTEEDSQFYAWRNNSFVSVGASYKF